MVQHALRERCLLTRWTQSAATQPDYSKLRWANTRSQLKEGPSNLGACSGLLTSPTFFIQGPTSASTIPSSCFAVIAIRVPALESSREIESPRHVRYTRRSSFSGSYAEKVEMVQGASSESGISPSRQADWIPSRVSGRSFSRVSFCHKQRVPP